MLALSALLSMLASCARYTAQPLTKQYVRQDAEEGQPVFLNVRKFSEADCNIYLGRNVLRKGIQPIQITVNNKSDRFLILTKDGISLPIINPEAVASKVETSTVGRAAGFGIVGLFIWPFLIPAVVEGAQSFKANEQLYNDYMRKAVDRVEILPHTTSTGVVFVPVSQMRHSFTISLIDKNSGETVEVPVVIDEAGLI